MGKNDTMGKSHPLLIEGGMRSASSALLIVLSTTSLPLFDEELSPPGEMKKSLHPRPKINEAVAGAYDSCPYRRTKAVIAGGRDPWASVVLGGELTLQHSSASE